MEWAGIDLSTPAVMGVLNVTPDSFSDGGDFIDLKAAIAHADAMCQAGAKIIDIGGESTRPGATPPDVETEIKRVVPIIRVVRDIARQHGAKISIDTRRPAVMRAAVDAGADIVNDVSALAFDVDAVPAVSELGCPVVLSHMRGTPDTMNSLAQYQDVVAEVMDEIAARIAVCEAAGIAPHHICIDPGIGFAKDTAQNTELLQNLDAFQTFGRVVMVGVSRKRFIGEITGVKEPKDRGPASLAAALFAVSRGAKIIRTHDVAETVQAIKVWQALAQI